MFWLPKSISAMMMGEASKWYPYETGGVFMGYLASDDVVVTDVISCGENSSHKRYSFYPDQDYQLKEISDLYNRTSGQITYLGDWHTHPNGSTSLSNTDKRTLVRIATTVEAKISKPVMGIMGGMSDKWDLNVVRYECGKKVIWPFVNCKYINMKFQLY